MTRSDRSTALPASEGPIFRCSGVCECGRPCLHQWKPQFGITWDGMVDMGKGGDMPANVIHVIPPPPYERNVRLATAKGDARGSAYRPSKRARLTRGTASSVKYESDENESGSEQLDHSPLTPSASEDDEVWQHRWRAMKTNNPAKPLKCIGRNNGYQCGKFFKQWDHAWNHMLWGKCVFAGKYGEEIAKARRHERKRAQVWQSS